MQALHRPILSVINNQLSAFVNAVWHIVNPDLSINPSLWNVAPGTIHLNSTLKGAPLDEQEEHTKSAWKTEPNLETLLDMSMPHVISTPCCASFIVSRERIIMRPKATYKVLQQWLMDTDMDNHFSGRIMEYTWHILFGDPPVTQALDEVSRNFCDTSTSFR